MTDSTLDQGPRTHLDVSRAYERAPLPAGVRLRLDANEGPEPSLDVLLRALADAGADVLRRYPDPNPLGATLARHFGIDARQVFIAAGADEVVDRCCRAFLRAGDSMLIADPSFEMFEQYASLCGARVVTAPWSPGPFPISAMLDRIDDRVAVIALVTPNNPTGEVATLDDLRRLSAAAPRALVILDHAYVDFANEDLTAEALAIPNVIVVRTFSKAWGLAGCRIGYALGPAPLIKALRAAGGPFPASSASLVIAGAQFETGRAARDAYVSRIRVERTALHDLLVQLNANPRQSQCNFVFAELGLRGPTVHASLLSQGIMVRALKNRSGAPLGLRISLPGDAESFAMLSDALEVALGDSGSVS
jgi:histidinol-phosphate aminotransferase